MSGVIETWWDASSIFACPDTDLFSARCQNREEHSPLAIHTASFAHVLVLLAAGFALALGRVLTCLDLSLASVTFGFVFVRVRVQYLNLFYCDVKAKNMRV